MQRGRSLHTRARLPGCLSDYDRQYMVFARLGADVSFVMSEWDEGIARWRFNLRSSNTEPLLRLNVEARGDAALMQERTDEILALIDQHA